MLNLKSDREIGLMRQAGLCVWQAHQLVRDIVAPGRHHGRNRRRDRPITSPLRRRAAVSQLSESGSRQGRRSRPPPAPASTRKSSTAFPVNEPLVEGDIVSVDTGCRLNGWCGDAAWTYPVGRISPDVQRLLDVTVATLDLAFELMHTKSTLEPGRPRNGHLRPRPRLSRRSSASSATASAGKCTKSRRCRISSAARCAAAAISASSRAW